MRNGSNCGCDGQAILVQYEKVNVKVSGVGLQLLIFILVDLEPVNQNKNLNTEVR